MSKPIILYSLQFGPNPLKVSILLEELGLNYDTKLIDWQTELKAKPYTNINPNGRVPTMEDPNTGITVWESGAIIEYLIATYDTSNKLSFSSAPEKWQAIQYLYFQMSGQGPYFGQAVWFLKHHPEDVPSAKARYIKEIRRVTMVLNECLQGKEYLVGNKYSFADLSFIPWYATMDTYIGEEEMAHLAKEFPSYSAWMERLMARPAVKKIVPAKDASSSK